jgi:hypothetical protein
VSEHVDDHIIAAPRRSVRGIAVAAAVPGELLVEVALGFSGALSRIHLAAGS